MFTIIKMLCIYITLDMKFFPIPMYMRYNKVDTLKKEIEGFYKKNINLKKDTLFCRSIYKKTMLNNFFQFFIALVFVYLGVGISNIIANYNGWEVVLAAHFILSVIILFIVFFSFEYKKQFYEHEVTIIDRLLEN